MLAAAAQLTHIRAAMVTASAGLVERERERPGPMPDGLLAIADLAVFDAGHPAPNAGSVAAGQRALELAAASAAGPSGELVVLLSGGASALLVAPAGGVSLEDKIAVADRLMGRGAPIHELNCVRKHLSRIKGGRLAAAARRTVTLALSDVHGPVADDPSVIGSGPTVPDESTFGDALEILRDRDVPVPDAIRAHLQRGARGEVEETIKPGDPRLEHTEYRIIGNRHTAMKGARLAAEARGYRVVTVAGASSGEAQDAGRRFVTDALRSARTGPVCVIASGETTVTVRGNGAGGRNQEFALGAALALSELAQTSHAGVNVPRAVVLASAGTDGIDGPTDAAGAVVDPTTVERGRRLGLDPSAALARNDTYRFFLPLGDLIRWGPTGTNVGDVHVALIDNSGYPTPDVQGPRVEGAG